MKKVSYPNELFNNSKMKNSQKSWAFLIILLSSVLADTKVKIEVELHIHIESSKTSELLYPAGNKVLHENIACVTAEFKILKLWLPDSNNAEAPVKDYFSDTSKTARQYYITQTENFNKDVF